MKSVAAWTFFLACSMGLTHSSIVLDAQAAGFYVPPKGAVGVGSAHVGNAARASDGNTVYANPAGMTQLEGSLVQGGIDFIVPDINIDNSGSTATTPGTGAVPTPYTGVEGEAGEVTPVPNLYIAHPLRGTDAWIGLAITSPFGLSLDYGSDWFGRYDSIEAELTTIDVAPSAAYRINDEWSVGGGIDVQYADARLTSALPNTLNPGGPTVATDGFAELTGDDWAVGFNIGVLYRNDSGTRVGLHYRSRMNHELDGSLRVSGLSGPLAAGNGTSDTSVDFGLPDIASLAIAQKLSSKLTIFAEIQWFGWESFDEVRVEFKNGNPENVRPQQFENTFSAGVAIEYEWTPDWTIRGGVLFDQSPTVDEFRNTYIPDSDQIWIGFGASHKISDAFVLDIGYVHSDFQSANINLAQSFFAGTPASGSVNTRGRTDNQVNVFSINLRYRF